MRASIQQESEVADRIAAKPAGGWPSSLTSDWMDTLKSLSEMKQPFQRYSGASARKSRMNAGLHGTTVIPLCSADEESMSDQEQRGEKAGLEARGICEYVCVCVCSVHEATVWRACLVIKVIRFSTERKKGNAAFG